MLFIAPGSALWGLLAVIAVDQMGLSASGVHARRAGHRRGVGCGVLFRQEENVGQKTL
ncbi:hypothetical protein [Mycobacterium sp. NAZ190054]|uniref:hypothetical protein n=1 Tax=Mycobacterium sp. NAZ190054 TaxID=1747766 RepID=UPI0012E3EF88|nr:hypothetical protein [Mycobacterium sp. NAZ190054]